MGRKSVSVSAFRMGVPIRYDPWSTTASNCIGDRAAQCYAWWEAHIEFYCNIHNLCQAGFSAIARKKEFAKSHPMVLFCLVLRIFASST